LSGKRMDKNVHGTQLRIRQFAAFQLAKSFKQITNTTQASLRRVDN